MDSQSNAGRYVCRRTAGVVVHLRKTVVKSGNFTVFATAMVNLSNKNAGNMCIFTINTCIFKENAV